MNLENVAYALRHEKVRDPEAQREQAPHPEGNGIGEVTYIHYERAQMC